MKIKISCIPNHLFSKFLFPLFFLIIFPFFFLTTADAERRSFFESNQLNSYENELSQKEIHIKYFGAVGDGITNDTKAFQKASAYLQANGGTLIIDPGTYIVGKQKLSGSYDAGSAYFAEPILEFNNATRPIMITGYKAILKAANGLKYGFFNPITGLPDSEQDFALRLNRIADVVSQQAIIEEINNAIYYIERNAHAKMLFHALTIRFYHILHNHEVAVVT